MYYLQILEKEGDVVPAGTCSVSALAETIDVLMGLEWVVTVMVSRVR